MDFYSEASSRPFTHGQISWKVVANEASVQPISAWPCIRDLNLPPNSAFPFFDWKKITMPALVLFIISMLNIPKQNLICSRQYHRGVSNTKVYGKAVRDAKNVIFKETTLLIFKSGHNFSRMAISDLFYAGKKFG